MNILNKHFYSKFLINETWQSITNLGLPTLCLLSKTRLLTGKLTAHLTKSSSHAKLFGGQLNKNWINKDLRRYNQNLNLGLSPFALSKLIAHATNSEILNTKKSRESTNLLSYLFVDKIILHSSTGKLLQTPSGSAVISSAFSTIACQTPTKVYSRKSVSGFKLSKSSLLGAKTTLRNLAKLEFYYKWFFLGPGNSEVKGNTLFKPDVLKQGNKLSFNHHIYNCSLPIKNVFIFTELSRLDYDTFSNMSGFEIQFISKLKSIGKL